MSLTKRFLGRFVALLSRIWSFFWGRTDNRFKRMCILASLHAALVKCPDDDLETISKLNDRMKLVKDSHALRFPTLVGDFVWKRFLPDLDEEVKSDSGVDVDKVAKSIPAWLMYSEDTDKVREELSRLISYCNIQRKVCTA